MRRAETAVNLNRFHLTDLVDWWNLYSRLDLLSLLYILHTVHYHEVSFPESSNLLCSQVECNYKIVLF